MGSVGEVMWYGDERYGDEIGDGWYGDEIGDGNWTQMFANGCDEYRMGDAMSSEGSESQ